MSLYHVHQTGRYKFIYGPSHQSPLNLVPYDCDFACIISHKEPPQKPPCYLCILVTPSHSDLRRNIFVVGIHVFPVILYLLVCFVVIFCLFQVCTLRVCWNVWEWPALSIPYFVHIQHMVANSTYMVNIWLNWSF